MIKSFKILPAMLLIMFTLSLSVFTQPKEGEEIDKIIAIVGNDIILQSELNAQLLMFAQQDHSLNPNDPEAQKRVLDMLINEKLVTMKAIEDSIEVTDEEIKAQWEQQLNEYVKYYGSIKRIEDIYGMSIDRMEYEFRDEIRKHLLSQKIKMQKFGEVQVTQREIEQFYEMFKDSLPEIPAQVELYHIVKFIKPSENVKEEVYQLALSVRDSILNGGDFADFAKRYSGDPGTQAEGGDLGWIKKGKLFPEFEKVAIDLTEGQISKPTETPFGYHLIQTLGVNKDSIHARHILFKLTQSEKDKQDAIDFLKNIKEKIEQGESFEEMAKLYSDEADTKGVGGLIGKFPLDRIPPSLGKIINDMKIGEISDPLSYGSDPKPSYHIIWKKALIPAHTASIEQDYKQLEQMTKTYKQSQLYQAWVEELRKTMYWEIKK
jgi:peptidyl-prolyl cis-trans isomerase SurA